MTMAQEFAALNEATRRAHEAIADMRTERKLMAEQLAEVRKELDGSVEKRLDAEVKRQLANLGEATQKAMDDSVERVGRKIDEYLELSIGTDAYSKLKGRQPIPDLIREARKDGRIRCP